MKYSLSKKTNKISVIAVVGATASGKTDFSIKLAKQLGGEIVSADSRLVYKGFDIACAKPAIEQRQGIEHYMIDIVEPEFDYSAGLYKKQASEAIEHISKKGKIPIIVGGTGLYIDILLKNYSLPQIPPDKKLRQELNSMSCEELFEMLKNKDFDASQKINCNDKKKIIRAIEIINSCGCALDDSRGVEDCKYDIKWLGCNFERDVLYKRIDTRVDEMVNSGIVEETKHLLAKHGRIFNLVNTIGYREIISYLDGHCTLEDAVQTLKKNTRNYAKRQLTWFRRNPDIEWNIYPEKIK